MLDKIKDLSWKQWAVVAATAIAAALQAAGIIDVTQYVGKLAELLSSAPTPTP